MSTKQETSVKVVNKPKAKNTVKKVETPKIFVADDATQEQARKELEDLLLLVKSKQTINPALKIVEQNINLIDELQTAGASLTVIYQRLNEKLGMGISAGSFVQYVRKVREKTGSSLLVKVGPRKKKEQAVVEQSSNNLEVKTEESAGIEQVVGVCEACKDSRRIASTKQPGQFFWRCDKCKTNFFDENGVNTFRKIEAKNAN